MPNVFDVANYFLSRSRSNTPWAITPLKLQKIVYYAQGWHLGIYGVPLFEEQLEAWLHGPVVPRLYRKFSEYGYYTIDPVDFDNYDDEGQQIFTEEQLDLLDSVWEAYGEYDGKFLEELTHQERPWLNTPRNNIITNELIYGYFNQLVTN